MRQIKSFNKFFIPASIFLLALSIRLIYFFSLQQNYFFFNFPASDVLYYQKWANEILFVDWIGKSVFWGMPIYPYFLAILNSLSFGNQFFVHLAHFLMGSINCVLIYYLGSGVFSKKVGVLAAILMSVNFVMVYYDGLLMPITLIIFMSLVILLILSNLFIPQSSLNSNLCATGDIVPGLKRPPMSFSLSRFSLKEWFFLGALIGLATLGDGKFLIFSALMLSYICFFGKQKGSQSQENVRNERLFKDLPRQNFHALAFVMLLIFGISSVLFPVALRNKLISGDWVLISAQSGFSFYVGNNSHSNGIFENLDFIRPTHEGQDLDQQIMAQKIVGKQLSPGEVSAFWRNQAWSFIENNPAQYLKLLLKKGYYFFVENEYADDIDLLLQRDWKEKFDFNSLSIICPLALWAFFLNVRTSQSIFVTLLLIAQFLFTLIFFVETKHRATILPLLILYESFSIIWIIEKIKLRQFPKILFFLLLLGLGVISIRPVTMESGLLQYIYDSKAGIVYEKQGDLSKARDSYLKALRHDPRDSNLLYNLGNISVRQGQLEEAVQFYQKALAITPNQIDVMYNLAFTFEQMNLFDQAIALFKEVLTLDPNSIDSHFRLAIIYQSHRSCSQAKIHYEEVMKKEPRLKSQIKEMLNQCVDK